MFHPFSWRLGLLFQKGDGGGVQVGFHAPEQWLFFPSPDLHYDSFSGLRPVFSVSAWWAPWRKAYRKRPLPSLYVVPRTSTLSPQLTLILHSHLLHMSSISCICTQLSKAHAPCRFQASWLPCDLSFLMGPKKVVNLQLLWRFCLFFVLRMEVTLLDLYILSF